MNSAAVIGRQLRQQQQTTTAGRPLCPPSPHKGRPPRTPSHQPHHHQASPPAAATATQSPPQQQNQQPKDQAAAKSQQAQPQQQQQKPTGGEMKSCVSLHCIWLCVRALSGGVLLIALGVGITVFGFLADSFAVHERFDEATNRTVRETDESMRMHMHNLTYVGPVIMGLGGMLIVAACVLTFDGQEDDPRSARGRRPSDAEGTERLLVSEAPASKAEPPRCNGPLSPFLSLAPDSPKPKEPDKVTTVAEVAIPNGPSRQVARPPQQLPGLVRREDSVAESSLSSSLVSPPAAPLLPRVAVVRGGGRRPSRPPAGNFLLSPTLFDEFVPSPQDIQIQDPDGCTPAGDAFELDTFSCRRTACATKCPPRLQLEPRLLASIESDGLSDSDTEESEFTLSGATSSSQQQRGGRQKGGRFCSPCGDIEEPLLGRCSPSSSPEYPMEPVLKRDRGVAGGALRRFQLVRQVPRTLLFDGPPSEPGGSR